MNKQEIETIVEECDPGIQDVVRKCLDNGFRTTDSGDGETKKDENGNLPLCALPFKNVVCIVEFEDELIKESRRLKSIFPDWSVEAGYNPDDGMATLILSPLDYIPEELKELAGKKPTRPPIDLDNLFTYHGLKPGQQEMYDHICSAGRAFAQAVLDVTPQSADQTYAIRSICIARMTANASIATSGYTCEVPENPLVTAYNEGAETY